MRHGAAIHHFIAVRAYHGGRALARCITAASMRRAWWLVLASASQAATAGADTSPWHVTLEAGAEADTNVQRVETDPTMSVEPIEALAMRTGAGADYADRVLGGTLIARSVDGIGARDREHDRQGRRRTSRTSAWSPPTWRWLHALGEWRSRSSFGVALQAADAFAIDADIGDRTFRNLGADGLVVLRPSDTRRLTLALGGRQFEYKPAPDVQLQRAGRDRAPRPRAVAAGDDGVHSLGARDRRWGSRRAKLRQRGARRYMCAGRQQHELHRAVDASRGATATTAPRRPASTGRRCRASSITARVPAHRDRLEQLRRVARAPSHHAVGHDGELIPASCT